MKRVLYFGVSFLTFFILLQSFQCSTREFTTAKVAIKNKEWVKALDYLDQELKRNPGNEEAWILKAETLAELRDLEGAAHTIIEAKKHLVTPQMKNRSNEFIAFRYTDAYNQGIKWYNEYNSTKRKEYIDSALRHFNIGAIYRPKLSDFPYFIASLYEMKEDTTTALVFYNRCIDLLRPEIEFADKKGIYVGLERQEVIKLFDKPSKTAGMRSTDGDSLLSDKFTVDEKETYIYYIESDRKFTVNGWRYDPPADWFEGEKEHPSPINLMPVVAVAQMHYFKKEYERALDLANLLRIVEPTNAEINRFIVQLYQEQGKTEEAIKSVEDLVKKNPQNEAYHALYGDILLGFDRFDEAIESYMKAIEIKPDFDIVYRNLGTAYKNKARAIQKTQEDMLERDKTYQVKPEEYFPLLEKSAEFFEKAAAFERYKSDFEVMGDLANIYDVLNKPGKLEKMVDKLEELEFLIPENRREMYYLIMFRIYDRLKNVDKMQEMNDKLQDYR